MAYVYIFQSGSDNLFKIGRTKGDVEKRRKNLSTGNPHQLTAYRVIETEKDSLLENYLHRKFAGNISKRSDATEFYEIPPAELDRGLQEAEAFMEEYLQLLEEAEELQKKDSNGKIIDPDDEAREIYRELQEVRARARMLDFDKAVLENKLKKKIGECDGIEGVAEWKTLLSMRFDSARFKTERPDVYQEYQIEDKSRRFKLQ